MKPGNKARNPLRNADVLATRGALVLLVGAILFGVIMHYYLGDPFVWQEEVQLTLIMWVISLGDRYALVCGNHAVIDVIVEMLPEELQKILDASIAAAAVIILCYVGYQGVRYIMQMVRCNHVIDILEISHSLIYAPLPAGCLTMVIQVCLNTYRDLAGKGEEA